MAPYHKAVTVPREMAQMIRNKVGTGAYASCSEVIREALRLFQTEERFRAERLAELKETIQHSINTGGPSLSGDAVFASLRERHRKRKRK